MNPQPFDNLGFNPRPLDVRDLQLAAIPTLDHPPVYMQDKALTLPIYWQGKQPACGAHAAAWFKHMLGSLDTPSPRYSWEDIKSFDGFPIEVGTDIRSILKSLQRGVLSLTAVPNDVNQPLAAYALGTDLTPSNRALAGQDVIDNYAFEDKPSFDRLKQLIFQHGAVVLFIKLGNEFWTAANGQVSYQEADILPLRTPATIISGHAVVAHSYDENYIYFANSFGDGWGRKGHGYFGEQYMPYVFEAGTAIDHATAVSISQKLGLLSRSLLSSQDPSSQLVQQLAALLNTLITILKSRNTWTILAMFLIGGVNAVMPLFPVTTAPVVLGLLAILAVYFHINPSQNYGNSTLA
jgi:hypothetical protein